MKKQGPDAQYRTTRRSGRHPFRFIVARHCARNKTCRDAATAACSLWTEVSSLSPADKEEDDEDAEEEHHESPDADNEVDDI